MWLQDWELPTSASRTVQKQNSSLRAQESTQKQDAPSRFQWEARRSGMHWAHLSYHTPGAQHKDNKSIRMVKALTWLWEILAYLYQNELLHGQRGKKRKYGSSRHSYTVRKQWTIWNHPTKITFAAIPYVSPSAQEERGLFRKVVVWHRKWKIFIKICQAFILSCRRLSAVEK